MYSEKNGVLWGDDLGPGLVTVKRKVWWVYAARATSCSDVQ